jgi:hypothetical protein
MVIMLATARRSVTSEQLDVRLARPLMTRTGFEDHRCRDVGCGVDMLFVSVASAVSWLSILSLCQDERDAVNGGRSVDDPNRSYLGMLAAAAMTDREQQADTKTVCSRSRQRAWAGLATGAAAGDRGSHRGRTGLGADASGTESFRRAVDRIAG